MSEKVEIVEIHCDIDDPCHLERTVPGPVIIFFHRRSRREVTIANRDMAQAGSTYGSFGTGQVIVQASDGKFYMVNSCRLTYKKAVLTDGSTIPFPEEPKPKDEDE